MSRAHTTEAGVPQREAGHSRRPRVEVPDITERVDDDIILRVNGAEHRLVADMRTSLIDALASAWASPGRRKDAITDQCGACTVLLDRRPVSSCLAVVHQNKQIMTAQRLAGHALHPLHAAS